MPWDYTQKNYKKQAQKDPAWHIERLVNYGLGKEKLNPTLLKRYLPELNIPEDRRAFLELLLWNKPF